MTAPVRILVVEDDPDDARTTFRALRRSPRYEPVHARSGAAAIEAASLAPFHLCLVDYRLPDMSGVEVVRRLRALGHAAPILVLSGVHSDAIVERALAAGADDFLLKHLTYADRLEGEVARFLGA